MEAGALDPISMSALVEAGVGTAFRLEIPLLVFVLDIPLLVLVLEIVFIRLVSPDPCACVCVCCGAGGAETFSVGWGRTAWTGRGGIAWTGREFPASGPRGSCRPARRG